MSKEIITKSGAIRTAGINISGLDTKTSYVAFPNAISSSDGLTAEGVNEIIEELKVIDGLVGEILKKFPGKLNDVAVMIESTDNAIAGQFK